MPAYSTLFVLILKTDRGHLSNLHSPDAPSLAKGWAYFEHFTLPRRFESKSGGHHIRAPPGEANGTSLYSSFGTPMESLSGKLNVEKCVCCKW